MGERKILVLGAGVSGLSTGIILLRKGYNVIIWAKDLPPYTTSNKAAAVWYPFKCGPKDKAIVWSKATLEYFTNEILHDASAGCKKTVVTEFFHNEKDHPWWKDGVESYKKISKKYLPEGYTDGYEIEGLVMDTDTYMEYLVTTFTQLGGKMYKKEITNIQEALDRYSCIINCTGLGSRTLFNDNHIYPCRGQILRIKPNGFEYSIFEQEGQNSLAYIIPRLNDIVIGGTAQDNNWSLEPNKKDTQEILRKCANLVPQFKHVDIIETKVGLRPMRNSIRLEIEKFSDKFVIHNYGHGGAGFTLSWGCAQNVVELIELINTNREDPLQQQPML